MNPLSGLLSSVPSVLFLVFLFSGCGGGTTQPQITQTSSPQDFSLTLSTNAISVPQGGTSSPVNVSVSAQNGFTGTVQITLSNLPSGIVSTPTSPLSVVAGANTAVVFGANPNATTGSFTITAQATSGVVSHSANLALAVQSSLGYTRQVYPNPAFKGEPSPYKFLVYDQQRQLVYLSAPVGIDVFDLQNSIFKTGFALSCPGYSPSRHCADDDVRGMALLPDGSRLVAADFGSQNLYLLDPDTPPRPAIATWFSATAYGPTRVAPADFQKVLVALSAEATHSLICASCVALLDVSFNPPTIQSLLQPELATITASPLLQADSAGDRVVLSFATAPGGPLGIWDATRQVFNLSTATEIATDLSVAADGTMFTTVVGPTIEVHGVDPSLESTPVSTFSVPGSDQVPNRVSVPGLVMHPTGALVYQPFLTGPPPPPPQPGLPFNGPPAGVDILDAHTGRLRLRVSLPEPLVALAGDTDGLHAGFLAIDENGQKIFALTISGLTVVQLTNVPLGIGTVSASSGATLTIRGSGFQTGTTVTIGGKMASVTFKDMNTLIVTTSSVAPGQQIVVANPDGETVTLGP